MLEIYTGELEHPWECVWHNIVGRLNEDLVAFI